MAVGAALGCLVVKLLQYLDDAHLMITASVLAAWISHIVGGMLDVSGVIATVSCGTMLGWYQHEVVPAAVRTRGTAFWQVVIFLMEALVFILIGVSLRGVIVRPGGVGDALIAFAPAVAAVLAAVLASRFVWVLVFSVEALNGALCRLLRRSSAAPDWRSATVTSWAGMRGVVTLAIALSLPQAMPGRDLILVAAFAVILVTVLGQGTMIGPLIRWTQPAFVPATLTGC